ncbi:spore cortex-lytic protein [Clostridium polyendosporum]|uniref:Spore cortex-lytic protein n=1 Tax=Clostridium polyendosporum TaxID=69208 RepID=A0A919RZ48_9CLOT|nr:peptidoglycan-binding domain-containing protein [Clostridium polyendosporum]GIM27653.1 spore cortex-lytic protein [Clostridium polyendosporum]
MLHKGMLKIQVFKGNSYIPVEGSKVSVIQEKEGSSREIIQNLTTDSSGLTNEIELEAPPIDNSMNPSDKSPYSLCNIIVDAPRYKRLIINGCQIYPNITSTQPCNLEPINIRQGSEKVLNISPNKLVGNYPPKIPENLDLVLPTPPDLILIGFGVVVPELVVIHDGLPDSLANDYTQTFKHYIKNVASSEIYPTWSESTIRANIYAIVSFTLNRVFTEWYKAKGKNFHITSSTAYDHAFSFGRNIFDNISRIVDEIFTAYIKRPNKMHPLLAQYCDGIRVQCPGWLSQWGSKYLGDQGKTPFEILRAFYGPNITLDTAKIVKGIPTSYPGHTLTIGSKDGNVKFTQEFLNKISEHYPAIPKLIVDGIYGHNTKKAVTTFQKIFKLPPTGDVDYATWYEISNIYVGVTKMAELRSSNYRSIERKFIPPVLNNYNIPIVTYFEEEE